MQDRFVDKHRFDLVALRPHDGVLVMFVFLDRLGMKNLFFNVPDVVSARAVPAQEARLIFAHLARDLVHDGVDRGVEIVSFLLGFDRDVIGANQDDLGPVAVFFDPENDVGFDDLGIIEMQPFDFAGGVLVDRIGDGEVAAGDFDGRVGVGGLHAAPLVYI